MKASEINKNLIGKKVSCINVGERVTGIITDIYEDAEHIGVRIKHNPIQWGADTFTTLLSLCCKGTELMIATEGNLKNTQLI
jgi:transcription antitermination factor NusA-like protein